MEKEGGWETYSNDLVKIRLHSEIVFKKVELYILMPAGDCHDSFFQFFFFYIKYRSKLQRCSLHRFTAGHFLKEKRKKH